jgi:protein-S-isoprenylcysteine O-methyltransferase Ste14
MQLVSLHAVGFVSDSVVPKTIDSGTKTPLSEAVVINLALTSLFALQRSMVARRVVKQRWTRFIPRSIERSTNFLLASLTLLLLFWQWRPMPAVIWHIGEPEMAATVTTLSLGGWVLVFSSTVLINHFELFGLHQVTNDPAGRQLLRPAVRLPHLYNFVRHPIYLGFIVALWAAPIMTAGHLLFAVVTTAYIAVGIRLEEHDSIDMFGDEYRRSRERLSIPVAGT